MLVMELVDVICVFVVVVVVVVALVSRELNSTIVMFLATDSSPAGSSRESLPLDALLDMATALPFFVLSLAAVGHCSGGSRGPVALEKRLSPPLNAREGRYP